MADYLLQRKGGEEPPKDYVCPFVVSAGVGLAEMQERYRANGDEYHAFMVKLLADRLAEATAELGHLLTRREWWGYAPDENLSVDELFMEKYQGKRPAVGYPSIPDQSINFLIDELIDLKSLGITLTESGAMRPHASTSGLMLAHPATRHFSVGQVGEDQLRDYAARRGVSVEWLRRFF